MDIIEEARRGASAYMPHHHYVLGPSPYLAEQGEEEEEEEEEDDNLHFFRTATGPRSGLGGRGGRQTRHASFRPRTMAQSPDSQQIRQHQPPRRASSASSSARIRSFNHHPPPPPLLPNDSVEYLDIAPDGGAPLSARGRFPGHHSESDASPLLFRVFPEVHNYSSLYPPRAASLPASIPPRSRRASAVSQHQKGKAVNSRAGGAGVGVRFNDILGLSPSEFEDMGRPKTPVSNTALTRPPPPPLSSSIPSPSASASPVPPVPPQVVAEDSGPNVPIEIPFQIPPPLHSKFPNVSTAIAMVRHRAQKGMQRRQEAIDEALVEILSELNSNISLVERSKFDDVREDYFQGQGSKSTMCPICTLDFQEFDATRNTKCGHIYHKNCLDSWLGYGHRTCPMCRGNVYGEDG